MGILSSGGMGLDLGSANVTICLQNEGVVLREPSYVLTMRDSIEDILAVGRDAKQMVGRTPKDVSLVSPVNYGAVGDVNLAATLMRTLSEKALGKRRALEKNRLVVSFSQGLTRVELDALDQAVRLTDGSVLRISGSQKTVWMLVLGMLHAVIVVALLAVGLSALLASRAARRVVEPLNRLDLEHPLDNNVYEELSPLLTRIHAQRREINRQTRDLKQRQDEFNQITDSMREGLLLLGQDHRILSINPAAQTLFGTDRSCIGRDFLTVDRRSDISAAVDAALTQGHAQLRQQRQGREYQIDLSRIDSGGEVFGAVLLAFDVTEQAEAERMRREFTANVSHELKTPLQSIIGSVELLENDLVQPEDHPRFLGRIHQEAQRLVSLINDILGLSQLDEGAAMPRESVSLLSLAQEAAASLSAAAQAQNVTLTVNGTAGTLTGVRRLLSETVRNLCENAVKYNVPGGSITVTVAETPRAVTLTVADTGIGIPPADQSRVFERFYRVDKSHSRAIGGTGLGLSIVKHAVAYHHGTVQLDSTPGQGTVITVTLPKDAA